MLDFLDWDSTVSLQQVFASGDSHTYPHLLDDGSGGLLYLTSIEQQQNRSVIMLLLGDQHYCLTPPPFNVRTRVNEYGGKPFWAFGNEVVFCNDADQCLYRVRVSDRGAEAPERLTIKPAACARNRYTDVNRLQTGYLAIVEQEGEPLDGSASCTENSMVLAFINDSDSAPISIRQGADFYSNFVLSPDQKRVAWVQWNHPNMPWDQNELWIANLIVEPGGVSVIDAQQVDLATGASVCQLLFALDGRLFFSADFPSAVEGNNFWNILALDPESNSVSRVTQQALEFGYPHWQYGDQRIVQLDRNTVVAIASSPESDGLYAIDSGDLSTTPVSWDAATIQNLTSDGYGTLAAIQRRHNSSPQIVMFGINDRKVQQQGAVSQTTEHNESSVSEHLSFRTRDGARAYGFFYPPCNAEYQNHTDPAAKPPLIVMVHGGPTARAYGHFDIQKQFWTSRGFAIFDVNHRGSSGYGRDFRDALYGHWGERDISDLIDGVTMLVEQERVDPERLCIRGKSAGGYAVLRALTEYPDFFKVGACYYGIGNLETLAAETHKFEKYYTDRLIGESYVGRPSEARQSLYYQRSPIHQLPSLKSAMIVFQGSLDKVVPPSVAQEIINVLDHANLWHEYVEYADEAHGFRQVANNIDALGKELRFYQSVLRQNAALRETP